MAYDVVNVQCSSYCFLICVALLSMEIRARNTFKSMAYQSKITGGPEIHPFLRSHVKNLHLPFISFDASHLYAKHYEGGFPD